MPLSTEYAPFCVKVTSFNKNSVTDTSVTIPNGAKKYSITEVWETNTSSTQGSSSATLSLYTAASAGGTAIVSAATATGLTAAAKVKKHTIAATDTQTGSTLYLRNTVAEGSALTVDVYIFGYILT